MQPGETITPGGQSPSRPVPTPPIEPATQPEQTPLPEPVIPQEPQPNFDDQPYDEVGTVSWSASEFVAHQKGVSWFIILAVATLAVAAGIYLFFSDILATIAIVAAGVTFGVFAARSPRVLRYVVDDRGLTIDGRLYAYGEIRSFAVLDDGPLPSILLMPLKRFLPPITLFCAPDEADKIIDALGSRLPHEDRQPDMVDRLMSKIRF